MRTVGVRELRAHLGAYLRAVRQGEVVLVTKRGRIIAELRASIPCGDISPELAGLAELAARGVIKLGAPRLEGRYRRSPVRALPGTARALLDEGREEP